MTRLVSTGVYTDLVLLNIVTAVSIYFYIRTTDLVYNSSKPYPHGAAQTRKIETAARVAAAF